MLLFCIKLLTPGSATNFQCISLLTFSKLISTRKNVTIRITAYEESCPAKEPNTEHEEFTWADCRQIWLAVWDIPSIYRDSFILHTSLRGGEKEVQGKISPFIAEISILGLNRKITSTNVNNISGFEIVQRWEVKTRWMKWRQKYHLSSILGGFSINTLHCSQLIQDGKHEVKQYVQWIFYPWLISFSFI